jgi:hypothetical protein
MHECDHAIPLIAKKLTLDEIDEKARRTGFSAFSGMWKS